MKLAEAEHLLGGYATGTLTEAERTLLLSEALDCQELFDALVDEEALRELLADPAARAQLLAALTPAPPKIIPFWRRTGVLGAAASLLVASIAGLAYLRSPEPAPPVMREETAQAPAAKAVAVPTGAPTPAAPARKAPSTSPRKETAPPLRAREVPMTPPPAPAPQPLAAPAAAMEDATRLKVQAEARDALAKKTEAPRPAAAAMVEVVAATQEALPEPRVAAQNRSAGRVPGGVVGGVAGSPSSPSSSAAPKAKALGGVGMLAATAPWTPTWTLDPQPDGSLRVTVTAPRGPQIVILKRGPAGLEALKLQAIDEGRNALVHWRGDIRLAPGDVLDLYGLNAPVTDLLQLPETGPVDGFRARIHPASKKRPAH